MDIAGTEVLTLTNSAMTLKGTTPTITIGDGGAEDTKIVFDGNAQDFYIGLDDSADDLVIGTGSTVGTNPIVAIENGGSVGIGTASPDSHLHLESSGATTLRIRTSSSSSEPQMIMIDGAGDYFAMQKADRAMTFKPQGSEAMRIDSSGNVGIGTSSPDAILETSASATGNTVGALLTNTNQSGTADSVSLNFGLGRTVDSYIFSIPAIKLLKEQQWTSTGSTVNGALVFNTIGSESTGERMRIASNGDLGWSTTSDVADSGAGTKGVFFSQSRYSFAGGTSTNTDGLIEINKTNSVASNNNVVVFQLDGSFQGDIDFNGGVVRYNTTSDYRRKENVTPLENATNQLKQLKTYNFNFIDNPDFTHQGFLAHEAQEVVPNAVSGSKDAVDSDGNPIYQTMDNSVLVPLLVKTIQELEVRITTLEGN